MVPSSRPPQDPSAILAKAQQGLGLRPDEIRRLFEQTVEADWPQIFAAAKSLTHQHFQRELCFFAPVYFSNYCINDCRYCGFRASHQDVGRRALSADEFIQEARFLWQEGHRTLLLVAGEHPVHAGVEKMAAYLSALKKEELPFFIMAEVGPLDHDEYQFLGRHGVRQFLLFQETYHMATYAGLHRGAKSDFAWRRQAMGRALEVGIERVGLGILLGLHSAQDDCVALAEHAWEIKDRFGNFPATFSFPRIRPAGQEDFEYTPVSDDDFKKILAVMRLAFPTVGIVLSTRESPAWRDQLIQEGVGITHVSAGVSTAPGGYTITQQSGSQFELCDHRSFKEVMAQTARLGYHAATCPRLAAQEADLLNTGVRKAFAPGKDS